MFLKPTAPLVLKPIVTHVLGRHLFARGWETNWQRLRDYLEEHPDHVGYLTDGGVQDVPKQYLAAVETGIRNTAANGNKPMGKLALSTAEQWGDPHLEWKKREAYITAAKKIMNADSDCR